MNRCKNPLAPWRWQYQATPVGEWHDQLQSAEHERDHPDTGDDE